MSGARPVRVSIEFEDGSARNIDVRSLGEEQVNALASLAADRAAGGQEAQGSYAVLSWRDGWQEVVRLKGQAAELIRYYVIRRIEDRGRLSFNAGGEWPELLVLKRVPDDLSGVLLVGEGSTEEYVLDEALERYEGTFEAGGKREYVKFDRTNPHAPQDSRDGTQRLAGMVEAVKLELARTGIGPAALLSEEPERRLSVYSDLAKRLGLKGHRQRSDLHAFIDLLVNRI